jgi:hypothetical protein
MVVTWPEGDCRYRPVATFHTRAEAAAQHAGAVILFRAPKPKPQDEF